MINNQARKLSKKTDAVVSSQANGYRLYSVTRDQRVVLTTDYETRNLNLMQLAAMIEDYAEKVGADKVGIRVPGHVAQAFIDQGYLVEASIPGYYQADEPMLFMTRYLSARRALASRTESKDGYHLEIRYRIGHPFPAKQSNLVIETINPDQVPEAVDRCLSQGIVGNRQDLEPILRMDPQVVLLKEGEQIRGLGGLLAENNGKVARIQGIVPPDSDEIISQSLLDSLWNLASAGGASCLYSLTNTVDSINRVLPAAGFSFRGQLGADSIIDGKYCSRYLWSRSC